MLLFQIVYMNISQPLVVLIHECCTVNMLLDCMFEIRCQIYKRNAK